MDYDDWQNSTAPGGINQKIRFTLSCHNVEYIVLYNMTVRESFSVKRDTIFLSRETSLYMLTYYYLTKSRVNRYEVTKNISNGNDCNIRNNC